MGNQYRICTDHWLGYEVQIKHWWFPLWVQADVKGGNTFSTIESAERAAKWHSQGKVVKLLGVL